MHETEIISSKMEFGHGANDNNFDYSDYLSDNYFEIEMEFEIFLNLIKSIR